MPDLDEALRSLRHEIDEIDEQIHALIVRRTEVIERVREVKRDQKVKVRAAREAEIAYRLVARHQGAFPRRDLIRIWREMIVATLAIEGPFSVSVYAEHNADAYWDLARDHFSLSLPMRRHTSAQQVVNAVARGDSTVGVLPVPHTGEPKPWWPLIAGSGGELPRVIARLPFAGRGNARGGEIDAFVVCPIAQEPTGRDRSLFAFEVAEPVPVATIQAALVAAGLAPTMIQASGDTSLPHQLYLVECDDFVPPGDRRIAAFVEALKRPVPRVVPLGGYAKPLTREELEPDSPH